MRNVEPPLAAALLTAICIVACLDPIKSADLECGKNGCLDASLADASPPVADAGTDAGGDAEVPRLDAEVRDAESPGIDADLPGLDADLPALDGGPTDAEAPDASRDASSPDAAPCTLLFSLGYPSGQVLETTCLRDIPHLRAGPCSGADDCHLDSRAFYPAPDGGLIESVTSRGRLWEYDVRTGAMLVDGGVALATVPHLAAPGTGVCAGRADAGCVLETRTFRVEPDGGVTEAITASDLTASGTAWSYEAFPPHTPLSTPLPNGSLLTARYSLLSSAPCYGLNPNECHFQTQAFLLLGNGDTLEFVTSAGKLFILDAVTGSAQADSNRKLSEIPRFRDTVCAGRAECRLRSHSFTTAPDGGLVESFSD